MWVIAGFIIPYLKKFVAYITLARKYRPAEFEDLYGQDILVKTISNAVKYGKISSAYILNGIRGIGKTSSARIIAKIVNCTSVKYNDNNIIVSCGVCKNCIACLNDNHPDIIELDAASNPSVDDIRTIITSCEYKALLGKYKIFIIDEVHMLSKSAFNAILKTLEEPPQSVIFIFATTELNKIPLTVISRCQKFDLSRISNLVLLSLMKNICKKENIEYEDNALLTIADNAEGSGRDSISLLEQAHILSLNLTKKKITKEIVEKMTGSISTKILLDLLLFIIKKDTNNAISLVNSLYNQNIDLSLLIEKLLQLISYSIKIQIIKDYSLIEYKDYDPEIIKNLKKYYANESKLSLIWQIFQNGLFEMKNSFNELLTCEMLIIKAICAHQMPLPDQIFKEVEKNLQTNLIDNVNLEELEYIYHILDLLYKNRYFSLYYYLLNEVEVIDCSLGKITISNIGSDIQKNNELKATLSKLIEKKSWDVKIENVNEIKSLKSKLLEKLYDTKQWEILKSCFTAVEVVGILHNNINNNSKS